MFRWRGSLNEANCNEVEDVAKSLRGHAGHIAWTEESAIFRAKPGSVDASILLTAAASRLNYAH